MTHDVHCSAIHAKVLGMSFLDKAKDLLNQHDDKVDQALDKAGEMAKERFAGHDEQIDGFVDQAQQRTGAGDTTEQAPPAEGAPADEPQPEAPQDQVPPQQ
ncbi:MAG: antitoxin [Pseudonocardia sp.]|nr:antitoxin [Pseudonocardia sp.]